MSEEHRQERWRGLQPTSSKISSRMIHKRAMLKHEIKYAKQEKHLWLIILLGVFWGPIIAAYIVYWLGQIWESIIGTLQQISF